MHHNRKVTAAFIYQLTEFGFPDMLSLMKTGFLLGSSLHLDWPFPSPPSSRHWHHYERGRAASETKCEGWIRAWMSDGCSGEARDALDETDSICPNGPNRWIIWTEEEMGGCSDLPQRKKTALSQKWAPSHKLAQLRRSSREEQFKSPCTDPLGSGRSNGYQVFPGVAFIRSFLVEIWAVFCVGLGNQSESAFHRIVWILID